VLSWSAGGDRGIATTGGASADAPRVPGPFAGCCIPSDSPWAAPDDDGIATGDYPGVIIVGLVVPKITVVAECAVLVDSFAAVGSIFLAIALTILGSYRVSGSSILPNVPGFTG
jgi:hypothetical protein